MQTYTVTLTEQELGALRNTLYCARVLLREEDGSHWSKVTVQDMKSLVPSRALARVATKLCRVAEDNGLRSTVDGKKSP